VAKHRTFIWVFISVWTLLVVAYLMVFRQRVVKEQPVVPYSYKQLLLEKVPSPRILIESGSNGLHAFNGEILESITGYPVVILSDHAGSSLQDKIARLERFARPGDQVLLPLEWGFYLSEDLTELHLRTSMGALNYYYYSLSLPRQLFRALQTPFPLVWNRVVWGDWNQRDDFDDEMDRLDFFERHHLAKVPYGGAAGDEVEKASAEGSICDDYILWQFKEGKPQLNSDFYRHIDDLARLQRKGVSVIVMPSIVVGNDCYEKFGERFDPLFRDACAYMQKKGIRHLTNYHDFAMDGKYFLNTHFHVDSEGRDLITPWIATELMEKGWLGTRDHLEQRTPEYAREALNDARIELLAAKMTPWRGNPTEMIYGELRGTFYYGDDWYPPEDWGRWARNRRSELIFRPAESARQNALYVNALYVGEPETTKVYLNGNLVAEQDFTQNHLLRLPDTIQNLKDERGLIRLAFESSALIQPPPESGRRDLRRLRFGLHSLELQQVD